jgi:hypothetical protein
MSDLEDVRTIQSAVARLVHAIDRRRWAELRPLFADTVETDYTSLFGGSVRRDPADELIATWRKMLTPLTATQHLLGPIDIAVGVSTASAQCHVRGWHHLVREGRTEEWMVAGHYLFAFEKHGAAWKVAKLTLETFYQTGNTKILSEAVA